MRSRASRSLSRTQANGRCRSLAPAGERKVPILGALRDHLLEHKLHTGRVGDDLVFGREVDLPFVPSTVRNRAIAAWEDAGLKPISLHEARHTFASRLIDAGVNSKAVQELMGHSTI